MKIPGWLWGLLAGLAAAAAALVMLLAWSRGRRPGQAPDPYQDVPELYLQTGRQELERAEATDLDAQVHQDEVAEILTDPDPDARTARLADLLNRWDP